jgi:hypothetical protein
MYERELKARAAASRRCPGTFDVVKERCFWVSKRLTAISQADGFQGGSSLRCQTMGQGWAANLEKGRDQESAPGLELKQIELALQWRNRSYIPALGSACAADEAPSGCEVKQQRNSP